MFGMWLFRPSLSLAVLTLDHRPRSVSTPYSPPAPPGAPLPTKEQVLARLPNFGYQYYFAGPDAPSEMQYVKEFMLASCLSPKFRSAQRASGQKLGREREGGDDVREGEMERATKKLVVDKKAGRLKRTIEDKVRLSPWYSCRARKLTDPMASTHRSSMCT